jgi:hypothetical protein
MAVNESPLRVVLNKWADVDADGKPKGVCIRDPKVTGPTREHIGMRVDIESSVLPTPGAGKKKAEFGKTFGPGTMRPQGPKETVAFVYSDEVVPIENTQFHREMVRRGNLFAADVDTFKAVFSTPDGFLDPAVLMANAEKHARLRRGLSVPDEEPKETSDTGAPAPAPPRQEDTADGTKPETSDVPVPRKDPTKTPPIVPRIPAQG